MSSGTLNAWLRTAFLALAAALLLDHVVTTTPESYAVTDDAASTVSERSPAGSSRGHPAP